jgi:hypothetical protein
MSHRRENADIHEQRGRYAAIMSSDNANLQPRADIQSRILLMAPALIQNHEDWYRRVLNLIPVAQEPQLDRHQTRIQQGRL